MFVLITPPGFHSYIYDAWGPFGTADEARQSGNQFMHGVEFLIREVRSTVFFHKDNDMKKTLAERAELLRQAVEDDGAKSASINWIALLALLSAITSNQSLTISQLVSLVVAIFTSPPVPAPVPKT